MNDTPKTYRVACAGIVVADTFCGPMDRLPHEGELLAVDDLPTRAGGCAANVAIDLAKQGVHVEVIGRVGPDSSAEVLLSTFRREGIGCQAVLVDEKLPTSRTVILLVKGADRRYIHSFGANRGFTISQIDREALRSSNAFYLGGLFAMPGINVDELQDLLVWCRQAGIRTVVDIVLPSGSAPVAQLRQLLPHIDCFLPNDDEASLLTGRDDPADQLRVLREWGGSSIIVTQGPRGILACEGNQLYRASAFTFDAIDPSGSGDAFASGIIKGMVSAWDMRRTIEYASALGGSATQAVGTTQGVFNTAQAEAYLAKNRLTFTQNTF